MLGLKRVQARPIVSAERKMSYSSDSDSEGCPSLVSAVPVSLPEGFAVLVVSGVDAVHQFELDYPTQYSRCLLAKRIDRGHRFTEPVPYSITLHEFPSWRVGPGFDSFLREFIPESQRAHHGAYNVSDWDMFDYCDTGSPPNSTAATEVSSPQMPSMSWTYDVEQPSTPPNKKTRTSSALDTLSSTGFDGSPLRALLQKRPWQRMSSQQCSPEHKGQTASAMHIPAPPSLQLASDAAQSLYA
jgi:hypothetical protein